MRLLFVALLLLSYSLLAQHHAFGQISNEQGLPSTIVFDLHQDTKGYIWVTTLIFNLKLLTYTTIKTIR